MIWAMTEKLIWIDLNIANEKRIDDLERINMNTGYGINFDWNTNMEWTWKYDTYNTWIWNWKLKHGCPEMTSLL